MRITLALLFTALFSSACLAQRVTANSPESQGHADRQAFEAWFGGLSGEQRAGAEFWAKERSDPKPVSCLGAEGSSDPEFVVGCQDAQRRLALPDVRRRTEPDYRKGWNADVEIAGSGSRPERPTNAMQPERDDSHATPSPETQSVRNTDQMIARVGSSAIGMAISRIVKEHPGLECSDQACQFERNNTPQEFCPRVGPCDNLVLLTNSGRVVGYIASFSLGDWSRSLKVAAAALGEARKETKSIGITSRDRTRSDYWSWALAENLELTYSTASGVNAYGAPVEEHEIWLLPPGLDR